VEGVVKPKEEEEEEEVMLLVEVKFLDEQA